MNANTSTSTFIWKLALLEINGLSSLTQKASTLASSPPSVKSACHIRIHTQLSYSCTGQHMGACAQKE